MKERNWSLDSDLDASIDGVDIPLFLNSVDIFAESILVLLSLLQLWSLIAFFKHLLTIKRPSLD